MCMVEVKCIGDARICLDWSDLIRDYLHKLGDVVKDIPNKVLLIAGEGKVVVGDSRSECITCDYDVVIPVGGDIKDVSRRAAVFSCLSTYYVRRALKGISSCSMPLLEGTSFYLAYLMSGVIDAKVRKYLENLLKSARIEDALAILREYGDLIADSNYRILLRSSDVNDVAEALRVVMSKSIKLKEDVKTRAVLGKYVAEFFRNKGVVEGDSGSFQHAVNVVPNVLRSLCTE